MQEMDFLLPFNICLEKEKYPFTLWFKIEKASLAENANE